MKLSHKFIKSVPNQLEDGVLYISVDYATAIHKCPCGCENQVVTPFSPTDWKLIFDGETVSLSPSIGNWSLKCQSHYWIRNNEIKWAPKWTKQQIEYGREREGQDKDSYFGKKKKKKFWSL